MIELDPLAEFREDHRKVRDWLLELANSLEAKNIQKAGEILGELDGLLGPHFRFEEESLYPALKRFLDEYVDDLLKEHDKAIEAARELARLIGKGEISDDEAREAAQKTRSLLVHVSNCDGLAILAERLDAAEIQDLGRKLAEVRDEGVSLLDWAEKIRKKL